MRLFLKTLFVDHIEKILFYREGKLPALENQAAMRPEYFERQIRDKVS